MSQFHTLFTLNSKFPYIMSNISNKLVQKDLKFNNEVVLVFFSSNFPNTELTNFIDKVLEIDPQANFLLCLFNTQEDLSDNDLLENFSNFLINLGEKNQIFSDFLNEIYEKFDFCIIPCGLKSGFYEEYNNFMIEVYDIPILLVNLEEEYYGLHGYLKFFMH